MKSYHLAYPNIAPHPKVSRHDDGLNFVTSIQMNGLTLNANQGKVVQCKYK